MGVYFQFFKENEYPVFVKFDDVDFGQNFEPLLNELHFKKIEEKELGKISLHSNYSRILTVERANLNVSRKIDQSVASFGGVSREVLMNRVDHELYRYQGTAMLVWGHRHALWTLGIKNGEVDPIGLKVVFTRFLSWALAPFEVLGFWGVPVEQGFVVMKQKESSGEAIFIDMRKNEIISQDGKKEIPSDLQILRLDPMLSGRSKSMSPEALVGYLGTHTTYLTHGALDRTVKESLFRLVRISEGIVYPQENFQPRSDLQLP